MCVSENLLAAIRVYVYVNAWQINFIYQVVLSTAHRKETYVGRKTTEFKIRYRNQQASFKDEEKTRNGAE